ncbi:hypothetical protein KY330_02250 [Candidatus Woesearchaeota archaeon]|nr:hypothetical protein [Candidatus Woesearchaeota archaeon]
MVNDDEISELGEFFKKIGPDLDDFLEKNPDVAYEVLKDGSIPKLEVKVKKLYGSEADAMIKEAYQKAQLKAKRHYDCAQKLADAGYHDNAEKSEVIGKKRMLECLYTNLERLVSEAEYEGKKEEKIRPD